MDKVTLHRLNEHKRKKTKFAALTAYDASFARCISEVGIEVILVGDSLGMVFQGNKTTIPVTIEQMAYHTECVSRGNKQSLIMVDMPFLSGTNNSEAIISAKKLMQAGAEVLKLEGELDTCERIRYLTGNGIPVCAHIGLMPQFIHQTSGYKIQGKGKVAYEHLLSKAIAMEKAGAALILLECIPEELAEAIDDSLNVPTIGIGAGSKVTGQILVLYDIIGLTNNLPRFVKNFMENGKSIPEAIEAYDKAVKSEIFPNSENIYSA